MPHLIPPDESEDHLKADYCPCDPFPMVNGNMIVWHHQPLHKPKIDETDLLEQAELIRAAESVDLWAKAELAGYAKLQVYKFASMNPIRMPGTTNRL